MSAPQGKIFNLPLHQSDHYWISLLARSGHFSAQLLTSLQKMGLQKTADHTVSIRTKQNWKTTWDQIYPALKQAGALADVEVAVTSGEKAPANRTEASYKLPGILQLTAESLWLGDALLENRIMCYLQPVVNNRGQVFGYESFARVRAADGTIIPGNQIIAASKALGIEFMIDRHLHVQAIKTFIGSEFNGFLFVNFFPGFIHRPAVYLEGLGETVKNLGVIAKHIVLDFTKSETPHDLLHIKSVCDYGRSRGYSIALDDISSVEMAKKLVAEIRPDFVKIDMHLVHQAHIPSKRETISAIVELVHGAGGTVIAEGVESEETYQTLKSLSIDLFQGYHFSPPLPVDVALKRGVGSA